MVKKVIVNKRRPKKEANPDKKINKKRKLDLLTSSEPDLETKVESKKKETKINESIDKIKNDTIFISGLNSIVQNQVFFFENF